MALTFGASDRIVFGSYAAIEGLTEFTSLHWVNLSSSAKDDSVLVRVQSGGGAVHRLIFNASGTLQVATWGATSGLDADNCTSANFTHNEWQCIAHTWDVANANNCYIGDLNTPAVDQSLTSVLSNLVGGLRSSDGNLYLGNSDVVTSSRNVNGEMHSTKYFSSRLTQEEIWQQQFTNSPHPDLILHVVHGRNGVSTDIDELGSGETGTISGAALAENAPLRMATPQPFIFTPSTTTDVTIALTGVSATASVGSLGVSKALALTTVLATASVGSIGVNNSIPITSVLATSIVGSLSTARSIPLTTVVANSAVGSVGVQLAAQEALTGVNSTTGIGSVSPSISVALSGVEATTSVGSLTPTLDATVALTGVEATASVGSLGFTKSGSVELTGIEATAEVGNVSAGGDLLLALTGVEATALVGDLSHSISIPLSGVSANSSVGNLISSIDISITGVEAVTAVGTISVLGAVVTPDCVAALNSLIVSDVHLVSAIELVDGFSGTITLTEPFQSNQC